MCRSIKPLRLPDRPATEEEITEAALQYVRKVSGYRKPSRVNQEVFDAAVTEIAAATRRMLESFPKSVTLKPAIESFSQGWKEAMNNDVLPIEHLWEGIDSR